MKKLIFILFLISSSYALAESQLPNCQGSDFTKYNNCFAEVTFENVDESLGIRENGDKYIGEFKDGLEHGQGTYIWVIGDKYVGEFKYAKLHGQGTYTYVNGDKYEGEYKDGSKHGQGTYTFADGENYVGEWKNDKRHGQGTYTYANGDKYEGEYKDGYINGQGTATYADGTIEKGIFQDGKLVAESDEETVAESQLPNCQGSDYTKYNNCFGQVTFAEW